MSFLDDLLGPRVIPARDAKSDAFVAKMVSLASVSGDAVAKQNTQTNVTTDSISEFSFRVADMPTLTAPLSYVYNGAGEGLYFAKSGSSSGILANISLGGSAPLTNVSPGTMIRGTFNSVRITLTDVNDSSSFEVSRAAAFRFVVLKSRDVSYSEDSEVETNGAGITNFSVQNSGAVAFGANSPLVWPASKTVPLQNIRGGVVVDVVSQDGTNITGGSVRLWNFENQTDFTDISVCPTYAFWIPTQYTATFVTGAPIARAEFSVLNKRGSVYAELIGVTTAGAGAFVNQYLRVF